MSGIERAYQVDAECRYPYLRQVPVEGEGAKLDELPFGETIATPAGGFVVDTKLAACGVAEDPRSRVRSREVVEQVDGVLRKRGKRHSYLEGVPARMRVFHSEESAIRAKEVEHTGGR